jgi:hypothetical protein
VPGAFVAIRQRLDAASCLLSLLYEHVFESILDRIGKSSLAQPARSAQVGTAADVPWISAGKDLHG